MRTVTFSRSGPSDPAMVSGPVDLHLQHDRPKGSDPYRRLIGAALRGDPSLFARQDGVMEAWRIVDPALSPDVPVYPYARGSWGPGEADSVLMGIGPWVTH